MISAKAPKFFFDREAVIKAAGAADARNLSKAGAYIRTSARSSMRRRKRVSKPGEPPSAHAGHLKEFLYFAWDPASRSVVVGPVGFNQKFYIEGNLRSGVIPELLEKGGTIGIREVMRGRKWVPVGRSKRREAGLPHRIRQATYQKRPYMGPALQKNVDKFPDLWKDSIRQ